MLSLSQEIQDRLVADGRAGLVRTLRGLMGLRLPGDHEILDVIGAGGQGIVCSARDALRHKVAVKLPLVDYHRPWDYGEREIQRASRLVEREARILSTVCQGLEILPRYLDLLRVPCPLHEPARCAQEVGPVPFLVMELVEGCPLIDQVRGRAQVAGARESLLRRAAAELVRLQIALEARGAVYVDLKPDHLRVAPDGDAIRLLDAGGIHLFDEPGPMTITRGYGAGDHDTGEFSAHQAARRALSRTLAEIWTGRRRSFLDSRRPGKTVPTWLAVLTEAAKAADPVPWTTILERVTAVTSVPQKK